MLTCTRSYLVLTRFDDVTGGALVRVGGAVARLRVEQWRFACSGPCSCGSVVTGHNDSASFIVPGLVPVR